MNAELDEWAADRHRARRMRRMMVVTAFCGILVCGFAAAYLGGLTASGNARYPVTVGWLILFWIPLAVLLIRNHMRDQARTDRVVAALTQKWEQAV